MAGLPYSIYSHLDISPFVAERFPRTNDTIELMAVLRALQIFTFGKLAICTNNEYVYLGVTRAAKRWKHRGWVGSCGPV